MSGWVSVGERLPKYGHVVIVWRLHEGYRTAFLETDNDGDDYWSVVYAYEGIDLAGSFWMPLPEPPQ